MVMFILRRLGAGVVLLFVSTSLVFLGLYLGSGDIARNILGQQADEAAIAAKEAELGLDRPLLAQYLDWLGNAVTGDLGTSWFTGQPVTEGIMSRAWVTLSLVLCATVLTAVISVVLGVWAAVRHGWVDKVVQVVTVVGFAIPNFLIAVGLVIVFAINLEMFQPTGYTPFTESPSGWLATVTLPIIALTVGGIAAVAAQVRGSMMDALRRDYVRTLRSRGLPFNRVVFKHVLRNAAGPALAVLAVGFVGLFGGAIIVERVFAIPGLSDIGVTSTTQGDIPMVMGFVIASVILVVVVNLVIDLMQGWLNPKVRLS